MGTIVSTVLQFGLSHLDCFKFVVGSNLREWWIDTGATRHVYSDKNMLTSFEPVDSGEKLFMGNSAMS